MTLRSRLLRLLRVPARPSAPAGDEDVQVFLAAPNYFRYRLVGWLLRTIAAAWGLVLALGISARYGHYLPSRIGPFPESTLVMIIGAIELAALVGVIVQATASLLLTRLDFEQRWYVVSDRSLRTREGLVRMHEKTMTFANIQHVSIRQGPLQRMLGIADLQIRTAGGGGGGSTNSSDATESGHDMHIAYLRGLGNASHVRDTIRERLRRHRDAGLGDPDDHGLASIAVPESAAQVPLLDAARALATEARALRHAHNA